MKKESIHSAVNHTIKTLAQFTIQSGTCRSGLVIRLEILVGLAKVSHNIFTLFQANFDILEASNLAGSNIDKRYSNFTDDDIGDEGITELFNYLSDSASEESKRQSIPQHPRLQNSMFGSQLKHLEEMSNDTGTFAFNKESHGSTLARESKERSLVRTLGDGEGTLIS